MLRCGPPVILIEPFELFISNESDCQGCVTMMGTGAIISRIAAVARAVTFRLVKPVIIFINVSGTARVMVTWTSLGVPASRFGTVTPGFGSTLMQSAPGAASAGEVQVPAVYPFLMDRYSASGEVWRRLRQAGYARS